LEIKLKFIIFIECLYSIIHNSAVSKVMGCGLDGRGLILIKGDEVFFLSTSPQWVAAEHSAPSGCRVKNL
jgi:hypothetical protein